MFLSVANAWPACDSLARVSLSELPSAVKLDPRYVNSSTSSMFSPCSFIGLFVLLFILMCFMFVMLAWSALLDSYTLTACPRGGGMLCICNLQSPDPLTELSALI